MTTNEREFVLAVAGLEACDLLGCDWVARIRADDRVRRARRELPHETVEEIRDLLIVGRDIGEFLADVHERKEATR